MQLYANSKLKYSAMFAEPLEKAGWHFQSQLLASKGQLLHSEGTSREVTNHKAERSAWGRRPEFFSQTCQYLQGSISQEEKMWRQCARSSLVKETNRQNKSCGENGVHLEMKKAPRRNPTLELGNGRRGERRRQRGATTKDQPRELLQKVSKQVMKDALATWRDDPPSSRTTTQRGWSTD